MPAPKLSAETIAKLAAESVSIKLSEADAKAVAELVGGLSAEMEAMRKLAVGESDPANIYHANRS